MAALHAGAEECSHAGQGVRLGQSRTVQGTVKNGANNIFERQYSPGRPGLWTAAGLEDAGGRGDQRGQQPFVKKWICQAHPINCQELINIAVTAVVDERRGV